MKSAPRAMVVLIGSLSVAHAQPAEERDVWVILPDGSMTSDQRTFVARIAPDGSVALRDAPNVQPDPSILGATFDLTDAAMRSRGDDPYASAKLDFLDRSRDLRVAQGRAYRAERLAHADAIMLANIDAMWARLPDTTSRKQALFELWDECAETGDPALVAAGHAARATVIAVAQQRLGPNAFTPAELSAFNARRTSASRFEPNGAPQGGPMVATR